MSANQQTDVKRRSSRAAREGGRRRRRSRTTATPQAQQNTAQATATAPPTQAPTQAQETEVSKAEARRQAKAESAKSRSKGGGLISGERTEGIRRFARETNAEIKKVVWPDRETTRNLTLLVITLAVVLGILLGGIDYVLFEIFEAF